MGLRAVFETAVKTDDGWYRKGGSVDVDPADVIDIAPKYLNKRCSRPDCDLTELTVTGGRIILVRCNAKVAEQRIHEAAHVAITKEVSNDLKTKSDVNPLMSDAINEQPRVP